MGRYRLIGRPYGVEHAGWVAGQNVGDEFDADFSDEQERALAGAGAIERTEGDTLQPESAGSGAETMDAPPHTAEPGVGYQEVRDELMAPEPASE